MGEQNQKRRKTRRAFYESHNQSELRSNWIYDDHMHCIDDIDHVDHGTCDDIRTTGSHLERRTS